MWKYFLGIAVDGDTVEKGQLEMLLVKRRGKVRYLEEELEKQGRTYHYIFTDLYSIGMLLYNIK